MDLAIKAVSGPLKDKVFRVKDGLTLGRQGVVRLDDPHVSNHHATIRQKAPGGWVVVDNGSKNGIKVKGERVDEADLSLGTIFYVGDSGFKVCQIIKKPDTPKKGKYWYDILSEVAKSNSNSLKDDLTPLAPLTPPLVLEFVRGLQAETRWVLGFGPRNVGANSPDLPIWEPGAPPLCFEILPSTEGLWFRTEHPEIVRLNNQSIDKQLLRMGDTIRILDTTIEVDFSE